MPLLPSSLAGSRLSISRLLSYAVDWAIIIIFAIVSGVLNFVTPVQRVFSLSDPNISYPYRGAGTVPFWAALLVGLPAPAAIIALLCLIMVPGGAGSGTTPALVRWKRKVWEINAGWMGLAMSLAVTFFITQGMKVMFGRLRPDFIARCLPDLDNIQEHVIAGLGSQVVPQARQFVDWGICTQTDDSILDDGGMSFPSGHASFSWAGMFYLSLYLCAKFSIAIPWALPSAKTSTAAFSPSDRYPDRKASADGLPLPSSHTLRSSAAAPPQWGVVLAIVPLGVAMYITASRYSDYRHHPFDLIVGSSLGIFTAWLSFRWYHAPIRMGAGWAWGPRSIARAWGVGVGKVGYRDFDAYQQSYAKEKNDGSSAEMGEARGGSVLDGGQANSSAALSNH